MSSPLCPFCGHSNPAAAKYCNDCGSPLHLKPCDQCEAVNDAAAHKCYNCGAEFRLRESATEAGPASAARDLATVAKASKGETFEAGHTPLPEWSETLNEFQRRLDNQTTSECEPAARRETTQDRETVAGAANIRVGESKRRDTARDPEIVGRRVGAVEAVARQRRSLARGVTPFFVAAQRATHVVPFHNFVATAGQRRVSRAALPALFLAALTVSAYYLYRHPVQLKDWLSARSPDADVPAVVDSGHTPLPAIPAKISVAPSAPTADLGSASNATVVATAPAVESATEVAASPVMRGTIRASGPDGVDAEARTSAPLLSASTAAQQLSTNLPAAAVQALAIKTGPAASLTDTAIASHAPSRYTTPNTSAKRGGSKQARSAGSVAAYPTATAAPRRRDSDSRPNVPPSPPRFTACTEQIAALALCN